MAKTVREIPGSSALLATSCGCVMRVCAPTRQRVELAAACCSADSDRHVTAESLHDEVTAAGVKVSLATVYNTFASVYLRRACCAR